MPKIKGIDIPGQKRIKYALAYIKGIGVSSAEKIIAELKLDANLRAKDLSEDDLGRISSLLDKKYIVEGELTRRIRDNIKRLQDIGTYRGLRHKRNLPVRGQRTRHNARTRKGPRVAVSGVSVRKVVSKT